MNNLGILQALIFEPRKAFTEIGERPRFWFPLLALIVCTSGLLFWYYQVVDLEWMTDQQLRNLSFAAGMTEEQIQERARAAGANPLAAGISTAIITALASVFAYLLVSAYYLLAGKVTNVQRTYRQWFALTCWSALPSLLTVIPAAFVLLSATSAQIDQAELRPLSLNALIFHRAAGEPGFTALSSVGLPEILSVLLALVGVRTWSGRSWLFSAVFVLLPVVLILGVASLFAGGGS